MQIICRWAYSYTKCQWHTKPINLFNLPRLIGPFASKYKRSTIGSFGRRTIQQFGIPDFFFRISFKQRLTQHSESGLGSGISCLWQLQSKYLNLQETLQASLSLLGAIKRVGRTHKSEINQLHVITNRRAKIQNIKINYLFEQIQAVYSGCL